MGFGGGGSLGYMELMAASLSIVIPTYNEASRLPACLNALVGASINGLVREVIICDRGEIASEFGARIVSGAQGRGAQLKAGAAETRGDWLLFLHADTVLSEAWSKEVDDFILQDAMAIGVFRLNFDPETRASKIVAKGAMIRTKILKSPYGDQGLLISRELYEKIGGYRAIPLFEDVDIIDRVIRASGRVAIEILDAWATTSAVRYVERGFIRRVLKNFGCILMFRLGVSPARIHDWYVK